MTLALADLGYTHREVYRMTPRHAITLWRALPDPDLAPKKSDPIEAMMGFAF